MSTQNEQKQRNWWVRNWKWLVPVGCLGWIAFCVGFVSLIVFFVFGLLKSSDAYQEALAMAQSNPVVIEKLGSPVKEGWYLSGNINVNGPSGGADIAFPISGPRDKATVFAVARKSAGRWTFITLEVEVKSSGQRINLLDQQLQL